ncbi:hypothetical protein ONE63_010513 [Megalurothrips usitatus]|uniref:Uncharacterized protein n=1 Tax=Megalurothrips usitatus TaxID=439358 RepID=A0AAV7XJQ5_9NEOP|nr:hypothetical protein ONE63_010513 [Megalurothrips usitatus]
MAAPGDETFPPTALTALTSAMPTAAYSTAAPAPPGPPAPPPHLPEDPRADPTWLAWALGLGGSFLVVLAVLAVLHRRGLLFRDSAWRRRPSHAQPWRDWGPRSRLPSLFDLLHYPQRRKSTLHPEHSHAAELGETPFTVSASAAQLEPSAPDPNTLALPTWQPLQRVQPSPQPLPPPPLQPPEPPLKVIPE